MAEPSSCFSVSTDILSRWKLDESSAGANATDSGSYGNNLSDEGLFWVHTPGVEKPNDSQPRARFGQTSDTTTKHFNLTETRDYAGDKVLNFTMFGWAYPSGNYQGLDQKVAVVMRDDQTVNNSMRWMIELLDVGGGASTRLAGGYNDHPTGGSNRQFIAAPTGTIFPSGSWNHIAFVYDNAGGYVALYQNGVAVASGAVTGIMGSGTGDDFALHGAPNDALVDFTGGLNDWHFVNRALSPGEIACLASSGTVESGTIGGYLKASTPLVFGNEEQMQAFWKLNEANPSQRNDFSGKGNHLDVIIDSPLQATSGKIGAAAEFVHWNEPYPCLQRTNSGVSTGMSPTTEDWTMGGWIKPSGGAFEHYAEIFGKGSFDQYVMYFDEHCHLWCQVKIDGIGYTVSTQPSSLFINQWQHVDWVIDRLAEVQYIYWTDAATCSPRIIASGAIPPVTAQQDTTTLPIHMGASHENKNPFDGKLDEWFFIQRALGSGDIQGICEVGLPLQDLTTESGTIGGYLEVQASTGVTTESGTIGGYVLNEPSGLSGTIGGYLENLQTITTESGTIGGYLFNQQATESGTIGGYLFNTTVESGTIGGYLPAFINTSGAWLCFFNFITPANLNFDAVARVGAGENADFDGLFVVKRAFSPPVLNCFIDSSGVGSFHNVTVSGTITPGDLTLPDGSMNTIESAWIQYGNHSGTQGLAMDDSGNFEAKYAYDASGVYIIRVDAIDANGVHGSCRLKIDLSVGLPANEIVLVNLAATPTSGVSPLTVQYTNTVLAQPVTIEEHVIYFGNRTLTHLNNPVHVYNYAGAYTPAYIVRDANGRFWGDSLAVGVNQ